MSDHIDGPRQIGDPSADLTDLVCVHEPGESRPDGVGRECLSDLRR